MKNLTRRGKMGGEMREKLEKLAALVSQQLKTITTITMGQPYGEADSSSVAR